MNTQERIHLLTEALKAEVAISLIGKINADDLTQWISSELGHADSLDQFHPHGDLVSKAYAPKYILHIVSGNTPHAAFQTLIRGLLLGSHNNIKAPSTGPPNSRNG